MEKEQELKVGDVLICINTLSKTRIIGKTTVGKEYPVVKINGINLYTIFDDKKTSWYSLIEGDEFYYKKYFKLKTETKMEKQIKMSLDTARKMYKQTALTGDLAIYGWLLENFTKEELEGKKGFTWEESFDFNGFWICEASGIYGFHNFPKNENSKNVFKTKEDAESALAYAQLTHIVAKYNEGKTKDNIIYKIRPDSINKLEVIDNCLPAQLEFYSISDATISLEVNRELWEKYWKIKK